MHDAQTDQLEWLDGRWKGRNLKPRASLMLQGMTILLGKERVPAKTLCECPGVDPKSCSDPDGGDDAGVNISIDARSAEAEKPSHLGNRERTLDPFDLFSKGNRWAGCISHPTKDAAYGDKLTRII